MDRESLRHILDAVAAGDLSPEEAFRQLKSLPYEDLGFAHVDHHRSVRRGYPETIFCQGKSAAQVVEIAARIAAHGSLVLATRANPEVAEALLNRFGTAEHDPVARTIVIPVEGASPPRATGRVLILSAGTADGPVAQEAIVTARAMNADVDAIFDVGVAGIHRLLAYVDRLNEARAIVVVAGMEGALASVVGGLVDVPVIAVPTSVGYGASFDGLAALLAMLNSCASGVVVVNIDNGYGAGYAAAVINSQGSNEDG